MNENHFKTLSSMDSKRNQKSAGAGTIGLGPVRYGLPCANCRLYYPAELVLCPICGCENRISP